MNYKIVFVPKIGPDNAVFERYYEELSQAVAALNAIADYTLMLHESCLMADSTNMGMIFKKGFSQWVEIDDDGVEI